MVFVYEDQEYRLANIGLGHTRNMHLVSLDGHFHSFGLFDWVYWNIWLGLGKKSKCVFQS